MRHFLALLLAAAGAASIASAQATSSPPVHELLLFTQQCGFTDPERSPHRIFTAEYYHAPSAALKLFGDLTVSRRFDESDRSAGIGAYVRPDDVRTLYGFLAVGFSPRVIPRADLSLELTQLLSSRLAGILGYRMASYSSETVHMLIPGLTLYQLDRWTFTPKLFLARLASDPEVRVTFFLHATCDLSERLMGELYYAVGSESYRAGALEYLAGQHAWGITIGAKIQISEHVRVRPHYQHTVRCGTFQENAVDAAISFLW
jgi:YaiO family outer membrane protein